MKREEILGGTTYRIKSPHHKSALFVTFNQQDGKIFEVFINTKDPAQISWTMALTRVLSAAFRQEDDVRFLVEELKAVHDPNGGFFDKGRFVPSIVSEIGTVLEKFLKTLPEVSNGD